MLQGSKSVTHAANQIPLPLPTWLCPMILQLYKLEILIFSYNVTGLGCLHVQNPGHELTGFSPQIDWIFSTATS